MQVVAVLQCSRQKPDQQLNDEKLFAVFKSSLNLLRILSVTDRARLTAKSCEHCDVRIRRYNRDLVPIGATSVTVSVPATIVRLASWRGGHWLLGPPTAHHTADRHSAPANQFSNSLNYIMHSRPISHAMETNDALLTYYRSNVCAFYL